ncbi:MAG: hypothetical protein LBJ10_06665, partial [Clostridiales bacterium]|jgi:hypothetical protein|nr:hypothetical protein [Clostridiales bacterium]
VNILPGTYCLDRTLVFSPQDSGGENCPVAWRGVGGDGNDGSVVGVVEDGCDGNDGSVGGVGSVGGDGGESCPATLRNGNRVNAAGGTGRAVISGGRPVGGEWERWKENPAIWHTDVPEARGGAWKFRTLFANGRREILARYPNFIAGDDEGNGYMYVRPQARRLLSGLATAGDWLEYTVETQAGEYALWLGYAAREAEAGTFLALEIDGQSHALPPLPATADYRSVRYAKVLDGICLGAGAHTLRIAHRLAGRECPVHLDTITLSHTGFVPFEQMQAASIGRDTASVVVCADSRQRAGGHAKNGFRQHHFGAQPADAFTIHTDAGQIKESWLAEPDAVLDIVVDLHYMDEMLYLDSIDKASGAIRVKGLEAKHPIMPSNYFFVSGILEELDAEREFYLDSRAGRLYYMPEAGVDPNSLQFTAPLLETIVRLDGDDGSVDGGPDRVQRLCFQNLVFTHAAQTIGHLAIRTPTDGAVKLTNAWNNAIRDCAFENVDGFCVWMHLDSCQNTVEGCEMQGMGSGGVLLTSHLLGYGEIYDFRPGVRCHAPLRNRFLRNHIHHGNRVRFNGAAFLLDSRPAVTATMPGSIIAYNHIHHMTRQGVFGFMNQGGNIIAHNHIHDVMTETADGGAVNIAAINNVTAPNIVLHNRIERVAGLMRAGKGERGYFGGFGIYPDWGTSHFYSVDNVVTGTGHASYLSNGGQANFACNNIFADDKVSLIHQDEQVTMCCRDNTFSHNILAFTAPEDRDRTVYTTNAWGIRERHRGAAREKSAADPGFYFRCHHNLYQVDRGAPAFCGMPFDEWRAKGQDAGSEIADPRFADPAAGNYALEKDSPAYALGFVPIDGRFGPACPDDPMLDFGLVTVAVAPMDYIGGGFDTQPRLEARPQVEHEGVYMVYADRVAHPGLLVEIRHADGVERFALADLLFPGVSYFWKHYLGAYRFLPGQGEIVFYRESPEMALPNEFVLLERSSFVEWMQKRNARG